MQKEIIFKLRKSFEDSAHIQDGIEYWLARDLQKLLEYDEWRNFLAEITSFNTKKNNLRGEQPITNEHTKNNNDVRQLLGKSGIKPEALPAEEDVKKIARQIKSEGKKIAKNVPLPKRPFGLFGR